MGLTILLLPHPPEEKNYLFSRPTQRDLYSNAFIMLFFYLNYYWLIPRLFFNKKYFLYYATILAAFAAVVMLPAFLTGYFSWSGPPPSAMHPDLPPSNPEMVPVTPIRNFLNHISHIIFLFMAVVLFSLLLRVRSRLLTAQKDKLDAELSSLKAQINPHFLFNALNSIYSLAVKKEDKTADAVINQADLMRYIIKDASKNRVPLQLELDYIRNYIDLQLARIGDTARVEFTVEGDPGDAEIAPLILISFVENAFKYGVNPDEDSEVRIALDVTEERLGLEVYNKKVCTVHNNRDSSTGVGLDNTRERIRLLYPRKHELDIQDRPDHFLVSLKIDLS